MKSYIIPYYITVYDDKYISRLETFHLFTTRTMFEEDIINSFLEILYLFDDSETYYTSFDNIHLKYYNIVYLTTCNKWERVVFTDFLKNKIMNRYKKIYYDGENERDSNYPLLKKVKGIKLHKNYIPYYIRIYNSKEIKELLNYKYGFANDKIDFIKQIIRVIVKIMMDCGRNFDSYEDFINFLNPYDNYHIIMHSPYIEPVDIYSLEEGVWLNYYLSEDLKNQIYSIYKKRCERYESKYSKIEIIIIK